MPFAANEIREARLVSKVVSRDGARVVLTLDGHTRADAVGPWLLGDNLWKPKAELPHGIELDLVGRAIYDLEQRAFAELELVAVGTRWGRTEMNGRRSDGPAGAIGFHLTLAGDAPAVAPTFIVVYNADWVDFDGSEVGNH